MTKLRKLLTLFLASVPLAGGALLVAETNASTAAGAKPSPRTPEARTASCGGRRFARAITVGGVGTAHIRWTCPNAVGLFFVSVHGTVKDTKNDRRSVGLQVVFPQGAGEDAVTIAEAGGKGHVDHGSWSAYAGHTTIRVCTFGRGVTHCGKHA